MGLNAQQVEEVNKLLMAEDLGFPEFRKSVSLSGNNQSWIQKALKKSGKGSKRLRELFDLD